MKTLNKISDDIVECVAKINSVSDKMAIGLVLEYKSEVSEILNERSNTLDKYNSNKIVLCIEAVDARIKELDEKVNAWVIERDALVKEAEERKIKNAQLMVNPVSTFYSVKSKNNI